MAMIFLSDEDRVGRRSVKAFSTIPGARTGRWCRADAGLYPDRCDCILEDLTNGVATHFTVQYGTINGNGLRTGTAIARNAPPSTPKGANHSLAVRAKPHWSRRAFFAPHVLGVVERAGGFEE